MKTKKNDNKTIICTFLGQAGNLKLEFKDSMAKFFTVKEHAVIRPDAFRFYYKGVKDGKFEAIPPTTKAEAKKPVVAAKTETKPPTKAAVKKAVAKTKVVTAAKV